MKLIVGLGNPGRKYSKTRHNAGFMFVDRISEEWGLKFVLDKDKKCEIASTQVGDEEVIFIKPVTYMNNSGEAVLAVKNYYNINDEDIFIIIDDMDIPFATHNIKPFGGTGGHNGMKSIQACLHTDQLKRLRIGIGKPDGDNTIDFVLSKFSKKELKELDNIYKYATDMINDLCLLKFDNFMNKYNTLN